MLLGPDQPSLRASPSQRFLDSFAQFHVGLRDGSAAQLLA
jgi:hypothetical protein